MNHKRKRPKSTRAGCLMCKAWKDQRAPKWWTFKASELRKMQEGYDKRPPPGLKL